MDYSGRFSYLFRKYTQVRVACFLAVAAIAISIVVIIGFKNKPVPEIEAIVPPVGSPGDVIVIKGKNFGDVRDMSYVEFAGAKLTASSYISWQDDTIKLVLPSNIQDGLVVVGVNNQRSKPALFANEVDIPVPVTQSFQTTKPVISSLSSSKLGVGSLLTIYGNNFGSSRGGSKVCFTCDYDKAVSGAAYINNRLLTSNIICACDFDDDYEYWNNNEIRVRVPDGAYTGVVFVDTGREKSDTVEFTVTDSAGTKSYNAKKIYLVQYSADISDVVTTDVSTITLRCPVPVTSASQPTLEFTEINPAPVLQNYQNCIIHQITKNRNNSPKSVFRQTFAVSVCEINTDVKLSGIGAYKNMNQTLYEKYTKADDVVVSDSEKIMTLAAEITGKETNAYKKAQLIYNYMLDNYSVLDKVRKNDADPLDMLKKSTGDAYDYAVIFASLARAAGIPALIDSGILIGQDLTTQAHWWNEIYLYGFGWLPLDAALGDGLEYKAWNENMTLDAAEYYFGNMDSHHIVFSRGYNDIKPFAQDNKTVKYPKSFALQSIWEEASSNTAKYSSYWSVPSIKGVY
ncbi:MAG: IPT/TIG domain-containing protein [Treponema sp.]|nr:IPT/TIG domain-containing protein [Treponema sp.]